MQLRCGRCRRLTQRAGSSPRGATRRGLDQPCHHPAASPSRYAWRGMRTRWRRLVGHHPAVARRIRHVAATGPALVEPRLAVCHGLASRRGACDVLPWNCGRCPALCAVGRRWWRGDRWCRVHNTRGETDAPTGVREVAWQSAVCPRQVCTLSVAVAVKEAGPIA